MHGVSIKFLYNLKNLLQRQMKREISGNYYKMRRIYLSFLLSHLTYLYRTDVIATNDVGMLR